MDVDEILAQMQQSVAAAESPYGDEDPEILRLRHERAELIDRLFAERDYGQAPAPNPYPDPIRPLVVGFQVGMPATIGGSVAGIGAPLRWLDSALGDNSEETGFLTSLAKVIESGGNWVSMHPWASEEAVNRLRDTVAYPIIDDDGQPIWSPKSWLTNKENEFDAHRRLWEATRSMAGNIGQGILPTMATVELTGGLAGVFGAGKFGQTALAIGSMSTLMADQEYRKQIKEGFDEEDAAASASLYGALAGPVEYAQAIIGAGIYKYAAATKGAGAAFNYAAERALARFGRAMEAPIVGEAIEGIEENIQGVISNPIKEFSIARMRAKYGEQWEPTNPDWYTLNDAYNDFAIGFVGGGFLRGAGKLLGMVRSGRETEKRKAEGVDTAAEPLRQDQRDVLTAPQATAGSARPISEARQDLVAGMRAIETGDRSGLPNISDITGDDYWYAVSLFNEDQEAGLKFWSDRLNQHFFDDTSIKKDDNEAITKATAARAAAIAVDDSRAQAFLNDGSAMDRPVTKSPLVAITYDKANVVERPIEFGKIEDDDAIATYLGLPSRTNGKRLPAEMEAIRALRTELQALRAIAPKSKVSQLLFGTVTMSPEQARRQGIDIQKALGPDGKVTTRLRPVVTLSDPESATIRLPRGFTLRDIRQAVAQVLVTENKAVGVDSDWNQRVASANQVVDGWWGRVKAEVKKAAMLAPEVGDDVLGDAEKGTAALIGQANVLLAKAQAANVTDMMPRLQAAMQQLQAGGLDSGALRSLAGHLDVMATGIPETSEATKARRLYTAMTKKNRAAVVAGMIARPDSVPASAAMTPDEAKALEDQLRANIAEPATMDAFMDRLFAPWRETVTAKPQVETQEQLTARVAAEREAQTAKESEERAVQEDAKRLTDAMQGGVVEEKRYQAVSGTAVVTPAQDAEYMAAVERGDMETAQRMVDEAARKAGLVEAWHRTRSPEGFNVFSIPKTRWGEGEGVYVSPTEEDARKLVARWPLTFAEGKTQRYFIYEGNQYRAFAESRRSRPIRSMKLNELKEKGYDSAIGWVPGSLNESTRIKEVVLFSPSQIKSADAVTRDDAGNVIPLSQRFNAQTPDIRYQQQEALPPITPAELDRRIAEVARQMGGNIVTLRDGTKVLRLAGYEITIDRVSELRNEKGEAQAGVNIRLRDTAMGGKIVGYRILLSDDANATTAAHEVVHAAMDMLEADERRVLAAEFGRTDMNVEVDEAVTQEIAEAIVTGRQFGTADSRVRIVWNRIKRLLNTMFTLRFGEAWQAVKGLPNELKADGIKAMLATGQVFERQGTQRQGTPEERGMAGEWQYDKDIVARNVLSVVNGRINSGKTMLAPEDLIYLVSESQPMLNRERSALRRNIELVMQDLVDIGVVAPSTILTDSGRETQGWSVVDSAKLRTYLSSDLRYQPSARQELDRELGVGGRRKSAAVSAGRMLLEYQQKFDEAVAQLAAATRDVADVIRDEKTIIAAERAITRLIVTANRAKVTDENAYSIGKIADKADEAVQEIVANKTDVIQLDKDRLVRILQSMGVKVDPGSKTRAHIDSMSKDQLTVLAKGVKRGLNKVVYGKYRKDAYDAMTLVRKSGRAGWAGDEFAKRANALENEVKANRYNRDWHDWERIQDDAYTLVAENEQLVKEMAEAEKKAKQEYSKTLATELAKADPRVKEPWHRLLIDFLAAPKSAFDRMGSSAMDTFYKNIRTAAGRANTVWRTCHETFKDAVAKAGWDTEKELRDAAAKPRTLVIAGKQVEMTGWQIVDRLASITDADTLKSMQRGRPVYFEKDQGVATFSQSVVDLFRPQTPDGKIEWINIETGERRMELVAPTKDWYSPAIVSAIKEFIAQTTPTERKIASESKVAMRPALESFNEYWRRTHGKDKFKEDWMPHTDAEASAKWGLPADTQWGYSPRFSDTKIGEKTFRDGSELVLFNLEETGVAKSRTSATDRALLIRNFSDAFTERLSQLTRMAFLQEPVRQAVNLVQDAMQAGKDGFSNKLVEVYGEQAKEDVMMYLQRAAGFAHHAIQMPGWSALARNTMIGRLAFRPTTYLANRLGSIPTMRAYLNSTQPGLGDEFAKQVAVWISHKSPENAAALRALLFDKETGYFYKRWTQDMFRAYSQTDLSNPTKVTEWNVAMAELQGKAMALFADAEQDVAIAAYKAAIAKGMTPSQAVATVEDTFRANQNPSDSLDESAALRRVKMSNWGWLFPFIGQTMAIRNLLADSAMALTGENVDAKKVAQARGMIVAIAMTMLASEAFRAVTRKIIRGPDEDEEEKRNKKIAMNLMRDALGTVAPGIGDNVAAIMSGQFTDGGMFAQELQDALAAPALGVKALTSDDSSPDIEAKQVVDAIRKTMIASATMAGVPASGGVDQLSQFLMERIAPPTKEEITKRRNVGVMDSLSSAPTKTDFNRTLRMAYKDAIADDEIDPEETSFSEFRNRFKARVVRKFGKAEAERLGFTVEDKKKEGDRT